MLKLIGILIVAGLSFGSAAYLFNASFKSKVDAIIAKFKKTPPSP